MNEKYDPGTYQVLANAMITHHCETAESFA